MFCKIVNDSLVRHLESGGVLHEGQAGFRAKRSCVDNIYVLEDYGRERRLMHSYDTVWRNGLWVKLWELGVRGKMWRVIKEMYRVSRSAVLLDGECYEGVAQGCSLSPILFSVFINGLLKEVEQAGLGVELSDGSTIGGMLFADDFVGVSNSEEELQRLINVAHAYCCKWRLKANV